MTRRNEAAAAAEHAHRRHLGRGVGHSEAGSSTSSIDPF